MKPSALLVWLSAVNAVAALPCPEVLQGRTIASIDLVGLHHTRLGVVNRRLDHKVGASFLCAAYRSELDRLKDLDVFADIDLTVQSDSAGAHLRYQFKELPPYLPYVSMAKTDQDGFSAGPAVAALNLFGTGAHAELATRFGGTTEAYGSLTGQELGTWPMEFDLLLAHVDSWNNLQKFHENSWRFKLDAKQPLAGSWRAVFAAEYLTFRSDKPEVTLSGKTDQVPRLGAGVAYDARDRRHLPSRGLYAELRLQQNGGWLGGDADYQEILTDLRGYQPLGKRNVVAVNVLHRWRLGEMGSYDLFRAGGANSLRGFPHGSTVGQSEAVAFIEDRFTLMPHRSLKVWHWGIPLSIEAVAGIEVLRSWDHGAPLEASGWESVYLGVHVLTGGLDRIRFEGGSNISSWQPNWDIGLFDKADAQRFRTR